MESRLSDLRKRLEKIKTKLKLDNRLDWDFRKRFSV